MRHHLLYHLLYTAILALSHVPQGGSFIVQDLVQPILWGCLSVPERLNLGAEFMDWAIKKGGNIVRPLGKTDKGQQIYEKL